MAEPKFKILSNLLNREEQLKLVPISCTRFAFRGSPWTSVYMGTRKQCKSYLTRKIKKQH